MPMTFQSLKPAVMALFLHICTCNAGLYTPASVPVPPVTPNAVAATSVQVPVPIPVPVPVPVPTPAVSTQTAAPTPPVLDVTARSTTANATAASCTTPLDFLKARGDVNVFVNAMQVAGLNGFLTARSAVQTIFAPIDEAFVSLLTSQGIMESQLLAQTDKLRRLLQNHILPNVNVKLAQLVPGASWPTINPNQVLTVATPVSGTVVGADLMACQTQIQEVNQVLVPPDVLPLGPGGATPTPPSTSPRPPPTAAPSPPCVQCPQPCAPCPQPTATAANVVLVPVPTPVPAPPAQVQTAAVAVSVRVATTPTPAAFSSTLDVTKINANIG